MNIADSMVVTLQYKLENAAGEILDKSEPQSPLLYLHGAGNLVPGVEEALTGKVAGDAFQVVVPPAKAYGDRDETMVLKVPRSELPEGEIEVGAQFQVEHDHGVGIVTITAIEGDEVTLDGNHPLAGETLHFDLQVVELRAATDEELEHGHVHGAGGHEH